MRPSAERGGKEIAKTWKEKKKKDATQNPDRGKNKEESGREIQNKRKERSSPSAREAR